MDVAAILGSIEIDPFQEESKRSIPGKLDQIEENFERQHFGETERTTDPSAP